MTVQPMIYLDHHSTTPVDPRVIDAMRPWMIAPANPHSDHAAGRAAAAAVDDALRIIADTIGTTPDNIVITSGATESNNLAIRGVAMHPRQRRHRIVTLPTEHPCVIDVTEQLTTEGFEVVHAAVDSSGRVDMDSLRELCTDQTALVSICWANNEIGVVADMSAIAEITHRCGAVLHSDATQIVGRQPIHLADQNVDLISASSHKFYGPRGIGLVVLGSGPARVRVRPQMIGGCQQRGRRGGTVDTAAVVGMATALRIAHEDLPAEQARLRSLRQQFWRILQTGIEGLTDDAINGPSLAADDRLVGNLNFQLPNVEGAAWITATDSVAFSSGSACSSVDPAPSHVLRAIGLTESAARRSVRFGLGRSTTEQQIQTAADHLIESYKRLVNPSSTSASRSSPT